MYLIQFLLPLRDNAGRAFGHAVFVRVRAELAERFGGVTAYLQAPASGLWKEEDGAVVHDEVAVFEVMADALDRDWWAGYRRELEARFRQEEVVVRALGMERL